MTMTMKLDDGGVYDADDEDTDDDDSDDDDGDSDLKGMMAVVTKAIMAIVPVLYVFWWATQRICLPLP